MQVSKFKKKKKKNKSDVRDTLLTVCGGTVLVLPSIILVIITGIFPSRYGGFQILAIFGCFIIGISLFILVVAAFEGLPLVNIITLGCLGLGSLFVLISLLVMYLPQIQIDEKAVDRYFYALLFLAVQPIFYFSFRSGVDSWLCNKKISNLDIENSMKGKKNFWWYESVHKQYNLGLFYYLNKFVTIDFIVIVLLALLLGWNKPVSLIVGTGHLLLATCLMLMNIFSSRQSNIEKYGKPFILFRTSESKLGDSSIFDLLGASLTLVSGFINFHTALFMF